MEIPALPQSEESDLAIYPTPPFCKQQLRLANFPQDVPKKIKWITIIFHSFALNSPAVCSLKFPSTTNTNRSAFPQVYWKAYCVSCLMETLRAVTHLPDSSLAERCRVRKVFDNGTGIHVFCNHLGGYTKQWDTDDGWNPAITTWDVWNPINKGKNCQSQLVSRISAINSSKMLEEYSPCRPCHCSSIKSTIFGRWLVWPSYNYKGMISMVCSVSYRRRSYQPL